MPHVKSLVWNYFTVSEENNLVAKCNFCKTVVNTKNGNTSSMRKHLGKHPTEYENLLKAEQERNKLIAQINGRPRSKSLSVDSTQNTVKDLFVKKEKVPDNSKEQQKFDQAMVDQLCCTGTPFKWVEHPKTVKLFDISNPTLTVKYNKV